MGRHLAVFGVLAVLIFPMAVFAHDEEDNGEKFLNFRGTFRTEVNILDSGNAVVFSPNDTRGRTHPAQAMVSDDDRQPSLWRNNVDLYMDHKYVHVWMNINTQAHEPKWPTSVGLKASILFPVPKIGEYLEVGLYHHSAHNLVEERYGKGSDVTGPMFKANVFREDHWQVNVWGAYLTRDKASAHVFTRDARPMLRVEMDQAKWLAGMNFTGDEKRYFCRYSLEFTASDGGFASMTNRAEALYKFNSRIGLGSFVEYNHNLTREDEFGKGEWVIGPLLEFRF